MNGFFYFMTVAIISIIYLLGYILSHLMLLTEVKSENETVTIGDRALIIGLSLLSWLMIVYILVRAWVGQINKTGYWAKPVKPLKDKEETK